MAPWRRSAEARRQAADCATDHRGGVRARPAGRAPRSRETSTGAHCRSASHWRNPNPQRTRCRRAESPAPATRPTAATRTAGVPRTDRRPTPALPPRDRRSATGYPAFRRDRCTCRAWRRPAPARGSRVPPGRCPPSSRRETRRRRCSRPPERRRRVQTPSPPPRRSHSPPSVAHRPPHASRAARPSRPSRAGRPPALRRSGEATCRGSHP